MGKSEKYFSQKTGMSKTEVLAFGRIKALCPFTTEGLVEPCVPSEASEMPTPLWPHCLLKIPPRYYLLDYRRAAFKPLNIAMVSKKEAKEIF